jgi:hypothetical protein
MGSREFDIPPSTLYDRRTKRRQVEVKVMLHGCSSTRELSSDQPLRLLHMRVSFSFVL